MTSLKQALIKKVIGHKYAIDAQHLGDDSALAWSNLGYWQGQHHNYPLACQSLADQIAASLQLKSTDRVLDLGCGQGASLLHWRQHYQIQQLSAVEIQPHCVKHIQEYLPEIQIHCENFLNLKALQLLNSFDAVLCIDAAYHSDLNSFINSVSPVLNSKGRIAFHTLMWSENWQNCTYLKKQKYHYLLKSADVNWQNLMGQQQLEQTLEQYGFDAIEIQDFSELVLNGFAEYIASRKAEKHSFNFAQFKIEMTAKLCRKLYQDGWVRYIQVSAVKK